MTGVKRDIALLERAEVGRAGPGDLVTVLDVSLDRNRAALLGAAGARRAGALLRSSLRGRDSVAPRPGGAHRRIARRVHQHPGRPPPGRALPQLGGGGGLRRRPGPGGARPGRHDPARRGRAGKAARARPQPQLQRLRGDRGRPAGAAGAPVRRARQVRRSAAVRRRQRPLRAPEQGTARRPRGRGRRWRRAGRGPAAWSWSCPRAMEPARERDARQPPCRPASQAGGRGARAARRAATSSACALPAGARCSADEFCRAFPGGGGRKEAAGIDLLPAGEVDAFVVRFADAYS